MYIKIERDSHGTVVRSGFTDEVGLDVSVGFG